MAEDTNARLQIIETLNRYAWGYDGRDLELMGNCFAVDGVFEVLLDGHEGWGPYTGRKAIVAWLASVMESQNDQRRHCVTNVIFRELGKYSALVESYLLLTAVEAGSLQVVCTGTYRDAMIAEEGGWRISRKTLTLDNPF
jgi:hypothetical protein